VSGQVRADADTKRGCGCLIALALLIVFVVYSCSGGSDDVPEKPATFVGTTPTTSRTFKTSPMTSRVPPATTTTTRTTPQGTPKPRPNPDPDPDPNRNVAPAPARSPARTTAASSGGGSAYYKNCAAARAAGAAPLYAGQLGYRSALDRDNDGVACE
jgi:hypothetical protein